MYEHKHVLEAVKTLVMNLWKCMRTTITLYVLMYTLTNEIILKDQKISYDKWIRLAYKPPFPPCEQNYAKTESLPLQSKKLFTILYIMAQMWCGVNSTAESLPASSNRYYMSIGWGKRAKKPSEETKFESSLRLALMHPHRCSQRQECISLSIDAVHQTPLIFSVKMLS